MSSSSIDHLGDSAVVREDGTVPVNVSVGSDGRVGLLINRGDSYAAALLSASETRRVITLLSEALEAPL
jgi:hypothetical protein